MRRVLVACLFAGLTAISAGHVSAQEGPGGVINPGRDCQTVTTCNFARGGRYRGCVSSYSCRSCRFVVSSCRIGAKSGKCRRLICGWGS